MILIIVGEVIEDYFWANFICQILDFSPGCQMVCCHFGCYYTTVILDLQLLLGCNTQKVCQQPYWILLRVVIPSPRGLNLGLSNPQRTCPKIKLFAPAHWYSCVVLFSFVSLLLANTGNASAANLGFTERAILPLLQYNYTTVHCWGLISYWWEATLQKIKLDSVLTNFTKVTYWLAWLTSCHWGFPHRQLYTQHKHHIG